MRSFRSISASLVILLAGCRNYYRFLQPAPGNSSCIHAFQPQFDHNLYAAYVDITSHHFSGIMLFKRMPDSSTRVIFTTELGVKFFDLGFLPSGGFVKYYMLPKLDKKIIVNALKNDISLVLGNEIRPGGRVLSDGVRMYIALPTAHGSIYYKTMHSDSLIDIERAHHHRPVEAVKLLHIRDGVPDSIDICHLNYRFHIALSRIVQPTGDE